VPTLKEAALSLRRLHVQSKHQRHTQVRKLAFSDQCFNAASQGLQPSQPFRATSNCVTLCRPTSRSLIASGPTPSPSRRLEPSGEPQPDLPPPGPGQSREHDRLWGLQGQQAQGPKGPSARLSGQGPDLRPCEVSQRSAEAGSQDHPSHRWTIEPRDSPGVPAASGREDSHVDCPQLKPLAEAETRNGDTNGTGRLRPQPAIASSFAVTTRRCFSANREWRLQKL